MSIITDPISDAFEWAGDVISDAADWVADEILEPVVDFVGDTISALADDPIATAIRIAAFVYGGPIAAAVAEGSITAMNGGDLGDVLTSAATAYVASSIGSEVNEFLGEEIGASISNEIVKDAVISGATSSVNAIIYGTDPVEAFLTGGIGSAVNAGLGYISEKSGLDLSGVEGTDEFVGPIQPDDFEGRIPGTAINVIKAGLSAAASGDDPESAMASALSAGLITADVVNGWMNSGEANWDSDQIASITSAIQRTASMAITGESGEAAAAMLHDVLKAHNYKAISDAFAESTAGKSISETLGEALESISTDYDIAESLGNAINSLVGDSENLQGEIDKYYKEYSDIRAILDPLSDEGIRLQDEKNWLDNKLKKINNMPKNNQADQDAYNKQVGIYNKRAEQFSKDVTAFNKANERAATKTAKINSFDSYDALVDHLNNLTSDAKDMETEYNSLVDKYETAVKNLEYTADDFSDAMDPLFGLTDKLFVSNMDANFDEEFYAANNDLDGMTAYEHYLNVGQFEGAITNQTSYDKRYDMAVNELINETVAAGNLDLAGVDASLISTLKSHIELTYKDLDSVNAAISNDTTIANEADTFAMWLNGEDGNSYTNAKMNDVLRPKLEALGFDTSGVENGAALSEVQKAALYTSTNIAKDNLVLPDEFDLDKFQEGQYYMQINDDGTRELKLIENLDSDVWSAEYGTVTDGVVWNPETDEFLVAMKDAEGNTYDETVINIGGGSIENLDKKDQYNLASMVYDAIAFISGSSDAEAKPLTIYIGGKPTEVPPGATPEEIDAIGKDAMSKMGATDALIDFFSNVMNYAKESGNSTIQNVAANIYKAGGGILKAFNGVVALAGIAPSDTDLGKFADRLVKLGEASNTEEYKTELKALQDEMGSSEFKTERIKELMATGVSKAEATATAEKEYNELPWYDKALDTVSALAGGISNHPGAFFSEYVGVEAMQELVPLAFGGVASLGAKAALRNVGEELAERVAKQAGITAAATSDLVESFGGTAAETYDRAYATAIKAGMSEEEAGNYAINLAVKSGTTAAVLTAGSFGVGGLALEKAILGKDNVSGIGGKIIDELQDRVKQNATIQLKEGGTELLEEGLVNAYVASNLAVLDPSIDVATEATAGAFMGFVIGSQVSGGIDAVVQTGDVLSNIILSTNTDVSDLISNPPSDSGAATAVLNDLGFSDPVVQTNLLNTMYDSDYSSTAEVIANLQDYDYYTASSADVAAIQNGSSDSTLDANMSSYVDPRYTDVDEVIAAAAAEGYTLTPEQAQEYVGQTIEADTTAQVQSDYDPQAVTFDESKEIFENTYGYTPTDNEATQFVGQGDETFEADTGTNIGEYVDPRQVTEEEATAMFENYADFDYEATPEEIAPYIGQGGADFETSTNADIDQHIDDNSITGDEIVAHATELGYRLPEGVDLSSWATQQPESDIATVFSEDQGAITYNLLTATMEGYQAQGIARDEALQLAIDDVATELGATKDELLEALGTTEQNLIDQISEVETSLGEQITGVEETLTSDIADLATQLGTTEENLTTQITDLATQLGTTEENLIAEIQSGDQNVINQLQEALTATETQLSSEIDAVSNLVGKPASEVTDTDIDFVSDVIANATVLNEAQTAQYDVTGDGVVDNADLDLLNLVKSGKPATIAPTSTFAPTGLYESVYDTNVAMEQNQEATMDALTELQTNINTNINQEALRSGIRDLLGMAMAAPDVGGQTVQVRTPDKLNLDYIYDFSSIFANPQQQSLFPSPYGAGGYAQGGQVTSTTDKLLKILGD